MFSQKLIDKFCQSYEIDKITDCWNWIKLKDWDGYGYFYIGKDPNNLIKSSQKYKNIKAHRFSYFLHKGDPFNLLVCHKCDNPSCVNPDHLFLGTHHDNNQDRAIKGRNNFDRKGEKNSRSKLTIKEVLEIRASQLSGKELSKIYGISTPQISAIKLKKSWKHI
jgi:hypothetical protein